MLAQLDFASEEMRAEMREQISPDPVALEKLRGAQAILRHLARHLQRLDALGLVADVPDLHRTVGAARGEVLALRVEGDAEDRV